MTASTTPTPRWRVSERPIAYARAAAWMEAAADAIRAGRAPKTVWLLEHPPLYSAGTSADGAELLDAGGLPVYRSGRGGRFTYHGPGQRIAYVLLDLERRGRDLHAFVAGLEDWIVAALARFGVEGARRPGRVGVWVATGGGREAKIAAIGVRVRRWVTFHGIAVNRCPELARFDGIVPCGIRDAGVTSLAALGVDVAPDALDAALRETFEAAMPTLRH